MALNGFLQSGKCYQDVYGAYMDYAISVPTPLSSASLYIKKTYNPTSAYGGLTGHYQFDYFSILPNGGLAYLSTVSIAQPVFPVCDPLKPFTDGAYFGSLVAMAFITISLLAAMRRIF